MLELKNITKDYITGTETVHALKGVSMRFRKAEFVSVLGPSGCGKTTLLNIVGGLDQYTEGDLLINGRSTKEYKSKDWDGYRNHSVGFVFQSYNLIPHQTVLENVEIALTLAGVSKSERKQRAQDALERVGLGDKLKVRPSQLSGGQMQRVAIARALVNDPDILLADEPTGALDTKTSVQVMDLLREISKDRLVIMVTHNAALADEYSTRIIRLLDGLLIDDTKPFTAEDGKAEDARIAALTAAKAAQEAEAAAGGKKVKKTDKASMSFFTAMALSFRNLMTKKARTFLVSFAGSIGIIGIALILSLSNGFQMYIDRVQEDTLSTYPLSIGRSTMDMAAMLEALTSSGGNNDIEKIEDTIYSNGVMVNMFDSLTSSVYTNDLENFKTVLEQADADGDEIMNSITAIKYGYNMDINIYANNEYGILKVNPSALFKELFEKYGEKYGVSSFSNMIDSMIINEWSEMLDNQELLDAQYDIVEGRWPKYYEDGDTYHEVVVKLDKNYEMDDYTMYLLGLKDQNDLLKILEDIEAAKAAGEEFHMDPITVPYSDIMGLQYDVVLTSQYFSNASGFWVDMRESDAFTVYEENLVKNNSIKVKVVGIIKPDAKATTTSISGTIGYRSSLTRHVIQETNKQDVIVAQMADPETDIFTGLPFMVLKDQFDSVAEIKAYVNTLDDLTLEEKTYIIGLIDQMIGFGLSDDMIFEYLQDMIGSYSTNLANLGYVDLDNPYTISIYPKDFEAKEKITNFIKDYNKTVEKKYQITYSDMTAVMMQSISTIINAISYVLIGFVSVSLIVSSIMIGIITYISVLERIKEIGILRSVGASKRNISWVFNAETMIIGLSSGVLGIAITLLLILPLNLILKVFTGIAGIASLPWAGALILVGISVLLSFIAGLIPSKIAANKDPVVALRTD